MLAVVPIPIASLSLAAAACPDNDDTVSSDMNKNQRFDMTVANAHQQRTSLSMGKRSHGLETQCSPLLTSLAMSSSSDSPQQHETAVSLLPSSLNLVETSASASLSSSSTSLLSNLIQENDRLRMELVQAKVQIALMKQQQQQFNHVRTTTTMQVTTSADKAKKPKAKHIHKMAERRSFVDDYDDDGVSKGFLDSDHDQAQSDDPEDAPPVFNSLKKHPGDSGDDDDQDQDLDHYDEIDYHDNNSNDNWETPSTAATVSTLATTTITSTSTHSYHSAAPVVVIKTHSSWIPSHNSIHPTVTTMGLHHRRHHGTMPSGSSVGSATGGASSLTDGGADGIDLEASTPYSLMPPTANSGGVARPPSSIGGNDHCCDLDDDSHDDHDHSESSSIQDMSFWLSVQDRAGWLVGLLVLQSMSSFIISRNERLLQAHLVIVRFLTMLVGAGGNAGNQASVGVIRGLATGTIHQRNLKPFLIREVLMAVTLSCILAVAGCLRAALFLTPFAETLAITSSLFAIVLISILLGALLPFIMKSVHIDPAHSSTSIQVIMDILGVSITVQICSVILDSIFKAENG